MKSMADAVVSFPKSGRTWLRVMLDDLGIRLEYTHAKSGHRGGFHFSTLNTDAADEYDRILLLYRDPRDTAVSGYHHKTKRLGGYPGSMADFVRSPNHGVEKIIRFNLMWMELAERRERMMVTSYEDLKRDTMGTLEGIARFFGHFPSKDRLAKVIEYNSFENMKKREAAGFLGWRKYGNALKPKNRNDANSFKVRKGKVGSYRDELSDEDIAYCDALISNMWEKRNLPPA